MPASRAHLVLNAPLSAESVDGLAEYSHCWIVFVFHSNTNKRFHPKVQPPRLGGVKVGCLATRTPHRWNDIGLSMVKLESIDIPVPTVTAPTVVSTTRAGVTVRHVPGPLHLHSPLPGVANPAAPLPGCVRLTFSGVDLVDGTPVLDVKPYHPSDAVAPTALTLPRWLAEAPLAALTVTVRPRALAQLEKIFAAHYRARDSSLPATASYGDIVALYASKSKPATAEGARDAAATSDGTAAVAAALGSPLTFYPTVATAVEAMSQTLSMDPRPLCTKKRHEQGIYGFVYDRLNVIYTMTGEKAAEIAMIEFRPESAAAAAAAFVGGAAPQGAAASAAAGQTDGKRAVAAGQKQQQAMGDADDGDGGDEDAVESAKMNKEMWLEKVRARLQRDD